MRLQKGDSMQKTAFELHVRQVTVGNWKREREEFEKGCSNRASSEGQRTEKRWKCEYEKVNEALFLWFT